MSLLSIRYNCVKIKYESKCMVFLVFLHPLQNLVWWVFCILPILINVEYNHIIVVICICNDYWYYLSMSLFVILPVNSLTTVPPGRQDTGQGLFLFLFFLSFSPSPFICSFACSLAQVVGLSRALVLHCTFTFTPTLSGAFSLDHVCLSVCFCSM